MYYFSIHQFSYLHSSYIQRLKSISVLVLKPERYDSFWCVLAWQSSTMVMLALARVEPQPQPTHSEPVPIWECVPGVRGSEPCLIWPGPNITEGRLVTGSEPIGRQFSSCQKYWPIRGQLWNWPVTSLTSAQSHYNGDKSAGAPSWQQPAPNLDLTG